MSSSRIKSIKCVGKMKTYDLHTPIHNNFFLDNGVLSHNSGKSYAAIKLAETMDKSFGVNRIVFTAEDFIALLKKDDLAKGSIVIWDEVGVGLNSKQWFSMFNKVVNWVLQVFRRRNLIVLFTTPDAKFIDSDTRRLIHGEFLAKGIDHKRKVCTMRFLQYENNPSPSINKVYNKYLRGNAYRHLTKIVRVHFSLPSKSLIREYEVRKKAYDMKLVDSAESSIAMADKKNDIPADWLIVYEHRVKSRDSKVTAKELGLSLAQVQRVINIMQKKGYSILSEVNKERVDEDRIAPRII